MADEIATVMGADQAAEDIAKWVAQLPADLSNRLHSFESELMGIVVSKEPVLTGRLAGSVEILPPTQDSFFGISLGRGVVYAGWIEFGGTRGREYIQDGRTVYPTVLEAEPQYNRLLEQATVDSINHYPWTKG